MAVKPIRLFGDPVLTTPAAEVTTFDKELRKLVKDLTDTMLDAPGAGLAAPQLGVSLRVFTYDVDDEIGHLVNPVLDLSDETQEGDEGCLSLPNLAFNTRRSMRVVAKGMNMHGEPVVIEGSELLARAIQHETDHLDGIVFIDRLDVETRKAAMKALTEVHGVIEKVAMQVQKIALTAGSKAGENKDKTAKAALDEIQMAGLDFKRTLTGFETAIAKQLEKLQEEKSADGGKIDIISLEGDMNGAIDKFKKDTKSFADVEKKIKMLDACKPAVMAMQAYSKAAARTEVAEPHRRDATRILWQRIGKSRRELAAPRPS